MKKGRSIAGPTDRQLHHAMTGLRLEIVFGQLAIGTPVEHAVSMARHAPDKHALLATLRTLASAEVARQHEAKLPALLERYVVAEQPDGSHWKRLALALAAAHEPGFRVVRTKAATGALSDAAIGIRVEAIRRQMKRGTTDAAVQRELPNTFPGYKGRTHKAVSRAFTRWKGTRQSRLIASLNDADLKLLVNFLAENGL